MTNGVKMEKEFKLKPVLPKDSKRGFGLLSPEERIENARRGGQASQRSGNSRRFTHEQAVKLGALGGRIKALRAKMKRGLS